MRYANSASCTLQKSLHDDSFARTALNENLNRLAREIAAQERRNDLFRSPDDEALSLSMRRPISTERAFALLGTLLGALPPAAIFIRMFGYGFGSRRGTIVSLFLICLAMNALCCITGRYAGSLLGRSIDRWERVSWIKMILASAALGVLWGGMTGGIGGLPFFLLGSVAGVVCAVPVGIVAFLLFVPLHRSLAHGSLIEAGHLLPLAYGVALFISALILSPYLFLD